MKERNLCSICAAGMLEREAEILRRIRHPGIPTWIDFFDWESVHCLVQEYVPGNALAELVNNGRRFHEYEVQNILLELLRILRFLHTPSIEKPTIFHRDLRLSNLILADNALSLLDFGLAHRAGNDGDKAFLSRLSRTQQGPVPLSSYAMKRNDFSVQSDLFGAGVVAVDLFTNSAIPDTSKSWDRRIAITLPFKAFIRRLLGVEGKFMSSTEAYQYLLNILNLERC